MSTPSPNTFNLVQVALATEELIGHNAEYLISYINEHKTEAPYTDALTRIGLVLKILLKLKANPGLPMKVLSPTIEDLTTLINTSADTARKVYRDELKYIQSCTLNDDLISLNTI